MFKKVSTILIVGAVSLLTALPTFAYEVKQGDTMGEIANTHGLTLDELSKLNPQVSNIDLIHVGETIHTESVKGQEPSQVTPKQSVNHAPAVSGEVDLLSRLVEAEAGSEPYKGKVAVAEVVLNRVNSSQFPNTISGVIYQNKQFSPVANGMINKPADSDSVQAVKEALQGTNITGGSLYFFNPHIAVSRWHDSLPTKLVIGNHAFK